MFTFILSSILLTIFVLFFISSNDIKTLKKFFTDKNPKKIDGYK
jgi:hypothetical protein